MKNVRYDRAFSLSCRCLRHLYSAGRPLRDTSVSSVPHLVSIYIAIIPNLHLTHLADHHCHYQPLPHSFSHGLKHTRFTNHSSHSLLSLPRIAFTHYKTWTKFAFNVFAFIVPFLVIVHVRYMLSPVHLSVVCNACAPYSGSCNFRQLFYANWYLGHPLTCTENFMEIVPVNPYVGGVKPKRGSKI